MAGTHIGAHMRAPMHFALPTIISPTPHPSRRVGKGACFAPCPPFVHTAVIRRCSQFFTASLEGWPQATAAILRDARKSALLRMTAFVCGLHLLHQRLINDPLQLRLDAG